MLKLSIACASTAIAMAAASAAEPAAFTRLPTAARAGQSVKIDFAVDRETDVAVYIEDAKGGIVRHLAAGMLGANAPEPLRAGLAQSLEWDGLDDDGQRAAGGPFKARVGLGLTAAYGGKVFTKPEEHGPNNIESIWGLAAGADGRIYAMGSRVQWLYWYHTPIHVFLRDGSYEKTIQPFPSHLKPEQLKDLGAYVPPGGRLTPLIHDLTQLSFYPGVNHRRQQMTVLPDGNLLFAVKNGEKLHLGTLAPDGSVPYDSFAGAALAVEKDRKRFATPFLAASRDGQHAYLTGLGSPGKRDSSGRTPVIANAVLRVRLPARGAPELFFGDPAEAGAGERRLNGPRGLACDGQGHLLVADKGNDRVVVLNERDGSFAGAFAVPAPEWLGVSPRSGAIYVRSGDNILRFTFPARRDREGWQGVRESGRTAIPVGKFQYPNNPKWLSLAVDAAAEPTLLWAGWGSSTAVTGINLFRCEERGGAFGEWMPAQAYIGKPQRSLSADPLKREVGCTVGNALWVRNEASGETGIVKGGFRNSMTVRLGMEGRIFSMKHDKGLIQSDRAGQPLPFPCTFSNALLRGTLPTHASGTTAWERDFGVDRRGDIYVKSRTTQYHGLMTVPVFGPAGNLKRTALYTVSDGAYGPRLDARGNLYMMEVVCPDGELFPPEIAPFIPKGREKTYEMIYGSVVAFGPAGGSVWFSGNRAPALDYEGWLTDTSIRDLRTAGGSLTGEIVRKPATLTLPKFLALNADAHERIVMRLKNDSDGTQATLEWHTVGEAYGRKPRGKTIAIQPHSDFRDYTFDLAGETEWKGTICRLTLVPSSAAAGRFHLDWVRAGSGPGMTSWEFDREDSADRKLPAEMKRESVTGYGRPGTILQGHRWWRPGFSPLGRIGGIVNCHCTGSDFDVDDFGRTFAPDNGRSRITVLDANGNQILHLGAYGNQDCCGPESYVLDPAGGFYRPRRADDPRDLASPFAEPDIALAWTVAVAVTDRNLYLADSINRRVLRVKLGYAAEETAALP